MNTWILDTAIARLLSTNAVMLTEQPNSLMAVDSEAILEFVQASSVWAELRYGGESMFDASGAGSRRSCLVRKANSSCRLLESAI